MPGGESVGGDGTLPIPTHVPEVIQKVVAGANEITDFPYVFGGGHASFVDNAYDCSGSVSYALAAGGLLSAPETSGELESWGAPARAGTSPCTPTPGTPTCTWTASCMTRPAAAACTRRAGRSRRRKLGLRGAPLAGAVAGRGGAMTLATVIAAVPIGLDGESVNNSNTGLAVISLVSIVVGWLALAALWYFVFRDRSRGKHDEGPLGLSAARRRRAIRCAPVRCAQRLSVELLRTVVVTGLLEAALRTVSRSISETLCARARRAAVFLESRMWTVLWPPLVVTRIAFAITNCGAEPGGSPTAGDPPIFSLRATVRLSRTSKRPATCSLTE